MKAETDPGNILRNMIVTIDGPAGSGKSTTATMLAGRLGLTYLDTGAMYRAVTLAVLERGIDPEDEQAVTALAGEIDLSFETPDGSAGLLLDGRHVEREIRSAAVSSAVSPVSRHPGVRRQMVSIQRRTGARGGIVAEGRDTGSTVFPFADVRIFLVADIDARAFRRVAQLESMGMREPIEAVRENISRRDEIDSGRAHSPLVRPAGSFVVDTSSLTIDEQVTAIERIVRAEAGRLAGLAVPRDKRNPFTFHRRYYRISQLLVRGLARLLFGLRITGREHLRYRENYLFASNHRSYSDPPLVGCTLEREVWFLAKKELFRNRLFAWLIRTYHAIPIDRAELDRATVRRLGDLLGGEESVLMFPEGTRSREGRLSEFKSGIGLIALRGGVPVVPVHISGSDRLRDCLLRRRRLEVRIGRPIRMPERYVPEDRKRDYAVLASMIYEELRMLEDESTA
jgi:cytidylate kinase